MKKGQLIPFVFVILAMGLILGGYIFYNIFYGTKYEVEVFHISILDKVRNLIEDFKNYLQLALTYSSHQALREHAIAGGMMPAGSWICNGPTPPKVEESKECLEKYTTYYLNVYMKQFSTYLPVELIKEKFKDCTYGVDESGVLSGKYDEGYFWVNCSKARIIVSGKNINITKLENIQTNDFITKNRYWYMFRIFTEWANANVYGRCMCGMCIGCGDCEATKICAKAAYEDLVRRFNESGDGNIICKEPKNWECCDHQFGPASCEPLEICEDWEDTKCKCIGHFCTEPAGDPPTQEYSSIPTILEPTKNSQLFSSLSNFSCVSYSLSDPSCACKYWVENRLAATYLFTCEDHKYYIPSDKGPVPLIFNVLVTAKFRCPNAIGCERTATCSCPSGAESCRECKCPPCPGNACY